MQFPLAAPIRIVLLLTFTAQTLSQSTNFPQCWQGCLQASDLDCKLTDRECLFFTFYILSTPKLTAISGICAHVTLSRLPSLRNCVATSCPAPSSLNTLLAPLQDACDLSKTPIPSSVISSLEAAATQDVPRPTLLLATPTLLTIISTSIVKGHTPTASAKSASSGQGGGDGTVLDIEGRGVKREPASLLGLTIGILAGIAWF